VQSEWYLGAQSQLADYTKVSAAAPAPDYVVFNGVAFQYKDHPIKVPTKGRVRVILLDAGPNIDSSFHIVGTIFDAVIKEGIVLARYTMVTHAFNFVGRGAVGIIQAGDGDPKH